MMIHAFLRKLEHLTTLRVQGRHSLNNMDVVHMTFDSCNVKSQSINLSMERKNKNYEEGKHHMQINERKSR